MNGDDGHPETDRETIPIVPAGPKRVAWFAGYQREMAGCRRCVKAGYIDDARPIFHGDAEQRLMIVGQAPGVTGHRVGIPWSGVSGKMLVNWLVAAGFDEATWRDEWYLTSVTKCFPGRKPGNKGDRVPSRAEIALCADHLAVELAAVQPAVIVTLGRLAATRILPIHSTVTLTDLVGTLHQVDLPYGDVVVIPFPHPSGVSRWMNATENRARVGDAIASLAEVVSSLRAKR